MNISFRLNLKSTFTFPFETLDRLYKCISPCISHHTDILPRHWPSLRLSRSIFNDRLNLADKPIDEFTCMARNLSKSNDSSRMDGGWEVSESLVTCSPCSRIGCHVPMERATWAFPFPISPFILSGLSSSLFYICTFMCVTHVCICVYILSLSLPPFLPLLPSPGGVAHSAPCGRKAYVKPVGLIPPFPLPPSHTTGTLLLPYDIHNVCLFTLDWAALPLTAYEFQLEYVLSAPN